MIKRILTSVVFAILILSAHAEIVIDSDFSKSTSNQLPAGWQDVSAGEAKCKVETIEDANHSFTRVSSTADRARIAISVPPGKVDFYRLTILSRDPARNAVGVSIRGDQSKKQYWHAVVLPDETWGEQTFLFQVEPHDEPASLDILVSRTGGIDLARVKLESESRDDLIARFKKDHPDGDRRTNLLRISRFPLGIQSGWGIDRNYSDEEMTVAADDSVVGPSDCQPLKIAANNGGVVATEVAPFDIPWPFIPHTASVFAKGNGHIALVVLVDGRSIAQSDLDLTNKWQRTSVTFTPPMLAETNQLQLVTTGAVWVDAMQVEPGEKATEYATALPCEVSLAPAKSEVSNARLQFIDEPPLIDFAASGNIARAILKSKVVNLYGEKKSLPDVSLTEKSLQRGQLRYDVFPDRPFGQFRIESWVEDTKGNRISTFNELVMTRVRRPRHWNEDAPDSPFGTHMNSIARHLDMTKAIGINWTRLHDAGGQYMQWVHLEREKGKWEFHDDAIARYRVHHIEIFGELGTAPPWATGVPDRPGWPDYWDGWNEPQHVEDYANYVSTVTTRYKDSIRAWDVWNEPWGKFWSMWDGKQSARSLTAADDFAKLQAAGFEAARRVDPKLTIAGINTMGGNVGPKWTAGVVNSGGLNTCDVYDYHFYNTELCGYPGDAVDRTFHESWDSADSARISPSPGTPGEGRGEGPLDKPVWMTEGNGANRFVIRGMYHHTLGPTVPPEDFVQSADYQSRYMARLLAAGVKKIFLYHINAGGEFRPGGGDFQSLVNDDAFAHPQAAAHSALAWELEDTKFVKHVGLGNGIHAWLFKGEGRSVAVILSEPKFGKYIPPHPEVGALRDLWGNDVPAGQAFGGTTMYLSTPGDDESLEGTLRASVLPDANASVPYKTRTN